MVPGTFDSISTRKANFVKLNPINAAQIKIEPNEDEIIVFPSKTFHSTSPSKSDNERISISADISVISKNSNKIEINALCPISRDSRTKNRISL